VDEQNNLYYLAAQQLAHTPGPMSSLNTRITIPPSAGHRGGVVTVGEVLVWALSEEGHSTLEGNPTVMSGLINFAVGRFRGRLQPESGSQRRAMSQKNGAEQVSQVRPKPGPTLPD